MEHQESSLKPLLITLLVTIAGTFLGALLALFVFRALTRDKTPKPSIPVKEPDKITDKKPTLLSKHLAGKTIQMPASDTLTAQEEGSSELDELSEMGIDNED